MSRVFFTSDLHFGHKNIHNFRKEFESEIHHRKFVMDNWQSTITKRDKVYVLGDAAFTMDGLDSIKQLNGTKILIRGNHDNLNTSVYLKAFKEVEGIVRYKHAWLSHAPIHPEELRGKINIHGHTHYHTMPEFEYENVCLEHTNYTPICWDDLIERRKENINATTSS